jgi:heat-inducible transcriptional repressor
MDGKGGLGDAIGRSATVLLESLVEHSEERLLLGGTANLTRNTADFGGSLRSVLEALEEQVVVLRLLAAQRRRARSRCESATRPKPRKWRALRS